MTGEAFNVGICFYCGKYTEKRFNIGWRVQRAPFCDYQHAASWRNREKLGNVRVTAASPRRQ